MRRRSRRPGLPRRRTLCRAKTHAQHTVTPGRAWAGTALRHTRQMLVSDVKGFSRCRSGSAP